MTGQRCVGKPADSALPRRFAAPILVVDDNDAKRLSILSVIEPLGVETIQASSGEAALRAVMEHEFAVILMDVQMPLMDGYETARLIRMRRESELTPIIFVTAHAAEEAQIPIAYASGAVDFIFGAIVPGILRAKVSVFVDLFLKSRELEHNLTQTSLLRDQFRDSEARTRSVLENVADGIVTVSSEGVIESFNNAAAALFGYSEQEAVGQPFATMLEQSQGRANDEPVPVSAGFTFHHAADRTSATLGRRRDGSTFPLELDLSAVQLGTRMIHIGCVRDISERTTHTEALRQQTLHDNLTGLPNRVLFADRVNHAIRVSKRKSESLALLVLDIDDFKDVNDTLGHHHGDVLLKLFAERLIGCLRDGDTVARLGGDEFGVLASGDVDLAGAVAVAWKIQKALETPFLIDDDSVEVRASIGIALFPDDGDTIDDLLRRSDLAMYGAKRSGTGYALFASEQEEGPARRLALLADLRRCVSRDELLLEYQPKIDLGTGKTTGVEALLRWNHPSGRLMMPAEFMPEVEKSELMIPITRWVIEEALHQLHTWREQGYDLTMAVNLGARCLAEGTDIFESAEHHLRALDIEPDNLTFELTESALIDTTVPDILARLEGLDERLSIDDFGTGYSSLVYLQRLPVVEIKADRSFVSLMSTTKDDAVIVRSIIDLAHNLNLKVVAEGVEDEATMELLVAYGCDAAQGYYFSRPIDGPALAEWLETSPFGMQRRRPVTAIADGPGL